MKSNKARTGNPAMSRMQQSARSRAVPAGGYTNSANNYTGKTGELDSGIHLDSKAFYSKRPSTFVGGKVSRPEINDPLVQAPQPRTPIKQFNRRLSPKKLYQNTDWSPNLKPHTCATPQVVHPNVKLTKNLEEKLEVKSKFYGLQPIIVSGPSGRNQLKEETQEALKSRLTGTNQLKTKAEAQAALKAGLPGKSQLRSKQEAQEALKSGLPGKSQLKSIEEAQEALKPGLSGKSQLKSKKQMQEALKSRLSRKDQENFEEPEELMEDDQENLGETLQEDILANDLEEEMIVDGEEAFDEKVERLKTKMTLKSRLANSKCPSKNNQEDDIYNENAEKLKTKMTLKSRLAGSKNISDNNQEDEIVNENDAEKLKTKMTLKSRLAGSKNISGNNQEEDDIADENAEKLKTKMTLKSRLAGSKRISGNNLEEDEIVNENDAEKLKTKMTLKSRLAASKRISGNNQEEYDIANENAEKLKSKMTLKSRLAGSKRMADNNEEETEDVLNITMSKRPSQSPKTGMTASQVNSQGDQPMISRLSKSQKAFQNALQSKKIESMRNDEGKGEAIGEAIDYEASMQQMTMAGGQGGASPECTPGQDLGPYDREEIIDISTDLECMIGERNPVCTPRCPRCNQRVFYGEKNPVDGNTYHRFCYTCANPRCKRPLDARQVTCHQQEIYCRYCYNKYFGPEGYGNANGVDGQLTINGFPYSIDCPEWNTVPAIPKAYIFPRKFQPKLPKELRLPVASAYPEICFGCGSKIDAAEKFMGANRAWHRGCFICFMCRRKVTPSEYCVNRDGEVCCRDCMIEPCDDETCALKVEDSDIYRTFKTT